MNKQQYNLNLGRVLREMRLELTITQEALAEKAGLSRNYISAVERGEKSGDTGTGVLSHYVNKYQSIVYLP